MEHRPPAPLIPPTAVDEGALRAAIGDDAGPDLVSPAGELTGAHIVGDDVVLELVLPRAAYEELELQIGRRYDLSHVVDDGVHVPVILSSSLALRVDEHADEHPWSVVATFDGQGDVFTAWGDLPAEAIEKASRYMWDDTPLGGPAPMPIGGFPPAPADAS